MKVETPAKINLGLWVLGERSDGYHEIKTFLHKITLFDGIEVEKSQNLEVYSTYGPSGEENIVFRAIKKLEEYIRAPVGLKFFIEKKIPIGGGLGGGSSDAACALKIARDLLKIDISDDELVKIGRWIGSDVPFFLQESPLALGEGRGDLIKPIKSSIKAKVIVVFPGYSISTSWAYGEIGRRRLFSGNVERTVENMERAFISGDLDEISKLGRNDFEEVIFEKYPEILKIKETLLGKGAKISMLSGSGSSVFALFEDEIPPLSFPPNYRVYYSELF
jgi:4-diphosphocytidyl-2-C-methyl-D-erythritol kinase